MYGGRGHSDLTYHNDIVHLDQWNTFLKRGSNYGSTLTALFRNLYQETVFRITPHKGTILSQIECPQMKLPRYCSTALALQVRRARPSNNRGQEPRTTQTTL